MLVQPDSYTFNRRTFWSATRLRRTTATTSPAPFLPVSAGVFITGIITPVIATGTVMSKTIVCAKHRKNADQN